MQIFISFERRNINNNILCKFTYIITYIIFSLFCEQKYKFRKCSHYI